MSSSLLFLFFFFNDTATTEIYTLSLHDALPISLTMAAARVTLLEILDAKAYAHFDALAETSRISDRKSTRLNSSHSQISYAVFCLKKKNSIEEREPLPPTTRSDGSCSR